MSNDRNQGAKLLARVGSTQEEIASKVSRKTKDKVGRTAVCHWLTCRTTPDPVRRRALRELYQIPESAWDEPASEASKSKPSAPAKAEIPDGVLAKAAYLEGMAQSLMQGVEDDAAATPLEKAKVLASIAATLNLLAKITGQFDLNSRFFSLPKWREIERVLTIALEKFPEAAKAVAVEIRKLEESN